jgi:hypothetical protein
MELSKLAAQVERLTAWVSGAPVATIEQTDPQRLTAILELRADVTRFAESERAELPICFLGSSGVGKSTLINALVDPHLQVVPQGGIGPLTAQATVVRYASEPYLHVTYHGRRRINQLAFALDRHCERLRGVTRDAVHELDCAEERELDVALPLVEPGDPGSGSTADDSRIRSYISQAKQLITGRQFGGEELSTEYLADGLRATLGHTATWGHAPLPEHEPLLHQLAAALAVEEGGARWTGGDDRRALLIEVARHATGSIAPLIKSLEVGWPADALRDGLVLVDLPGIGIANDEYRSVTSAWIRRASAVVLVVDKSGVTEAGADLLHTTGFLNSILHRAPESIAVSPLLRVVAVKLDDVANAERTSFKAQHPGAKVPSWLELFRGACDQSRTLIRSQLEQVFEQSVNAAPPETRSERQDALRQTLATMQVYPVSAIEYRKVLDDDPDDAPKIKDAAHSNIPALAVSLSELARHHHDELIAAYQVTARRLLDAIERCLVRVEQELSGDELPVVQLAELRASLDTAMRSATDELKPRMGALREKLRGTIPQTIEVEVARAVSAAERGVRAYVATLQKLPWATLRATIRRGGTWIRSRPIDLPNELALRFEEPLAVAWSRGAVAPLRKALKEFAIDLGRLLGKAILWARTQPALDAAHVVRFHAEAETEVASLVTRGDVAAADLTQHANQHLQSGIQDEIRRACEGFIDERLDVGVGVKARLAAFLERLVPGVSQVARTTAARFFRATYDAVLTQVTGGFPRFDDPVAYASGMLLGGQERDVQRVAPRVEELHRVRTLCGELAALRAEVDA